MPTERTTKHSKEQEQDGEMSLSGHLRELRNRILACVIVLVVAILADFTMHRRLYRFSFRWEKAWIMSSYISHRRS